jgi:ribosomal protein L11 methyltransferase
VAAVKFGARKVVAVDIDPTSVQVARENAARNQVLYETSTGDGLEELEGTFDVLVSNIISATLIRLAPDAIRYITPGGVWIMSGVIVQNWREVLRSATEAGFLLESHREEDGWVAARFIKNGDV